MTLHFLYLFDIIVWLFFAGSVVYVFFFAVISLFPDRKKEEPTLDDTRYSKFLILYPAYKEDRVIRYSVESFLQQDYPPAFFTLGVISDHMTEETNLWLSEHPITLFTPTFEKSTKAKALQYAIDRLSENKENYDYIVILDADNIVRPDFLSSLNRVCQQGHKAIQCHRCAKNNDNDIAILDGVSEEINNALFRRAHNRIGLSSALIGSGMCFDYLWFRKNVHQLHTAVEDRELESMLFKDSIYIHYEESIPVYDEKVSSKENFQRQRLRWMSGQVQSLRNALPYLPTALRTFNVNYIDKVMQLALIPRSILIVCLPIIAFVVTLISWPHSVKWWVLAAMQALALFFAIPSKVRSKATFHLFLTVPRLVWLMLKNLFHMNTRSNEFLHTTHDSNQTGPQL